MISPARVASQVLSATALNYTIIYRMFQDTEKKTFEKFCRNKKSVQCQCITLFLFRICGAVSGQCFAVSLNIYLDSLQAIC